MSDAARNPLISAHKAESGALHVHLHPLVLLTISDYITRHTLRGLSSPIAGAILGQQNGREISLEYAFECKTTTDETTVRFDPSWFEARVLQYKQVHKAPALEIVGWFTTAPLDGPQERHLSIHRQLLKFYNESAVLLAFHPSQLASDDSNGGKLPLTIYESVAEGPDGQMDVEGEESQDRIRFRELSYSIETGEAEMISVDFVARGGGNATAIEDTPQPTAQDTAMDIDSKPQLPVKGDEKSASKTQERRVVDVLSVEDEELIAALTAKANAVKMLHSRIQLLSAYLRKLPPSYLNLSAGIDPATAECSDGAVDVNHTVLRSIQALVNRLPLLVPADRANFQQELLAEKKDVAIVALLGRLNSSIKDIRDVGIKHSISENQKIQTKKGQVVDDNLAKLGIMSGPDMYDPFFGGSRTGRSPNPYDPL